MERTTETWFEVQQSLVEENFWQPVDREQYATARAARVALRKAKREEEARQRRAPAWKFEEQQPRARFEHRIVRRTLVEEVWPERHVKPPHGKCAECGHYGASCTGAAA